MTSRFLAFYAMHSLDTVFPPCSNNVLAVSKDGERVPSVRSCGAEKKLEANSLAQSVRNLLWETGGATVHANKGNNGSSVQVQQKTWPTCLNFRARPFFLSQRGRGFAPHLPQSSPTLTLKKSCHANPSPLNSALFPIWCCRQIGYGKLLDPSSLSPPISRCLSLSHTLALSLARVDYRSREARVMS